MPDRAFIQAFLDHRIRVTDQNIRAEVHRVPASRDYVVRMSTVMEGSIRISQQELMASRENALRFVDHGLEAFRRRVSGQDTADLQDIARMRYEREQERDASRRALSATPWRAEPHEDLRSLLGVSNQTILANFSNFTAGMPVQVSTSDGSTMTSVPRTEDTRLTGIRLPGPPTVKAARPPKALSLWQRLDDEAWDLTG